MRYLTFDDVLELHQMILAQSGGSPGLRDRGGLESAVAQPQMTFGGEELYPTVIDKAAALGFSLISNHPFVDGNKRIGHFAMEVTLVFNGMQVIADVDEQEKLILEVAAGQCPRESFREWVKQHVSELPPP